MIDAAEQGRQQKFASAAVESKLPEKVARELVRDAQYPASFKKTLKISTPRVAAKWLNKAGVSAEHADEAAFVLSLGAIFLQGRKLSAKLDKLIEAAKEKPATEPKAEKKP